MPNGLILIDRYTPKVGLGGPMIEALRHKDEVWRAQGLPGFSIWKPYDGPHNGFVTVQRWPSFGEWEKIRNTLASIPECRSAVFDTLYPTNETPYYTTYYEDIQGGVPMPTGGTTADPAGSTEPNGLILIDRYTPKVGLGGPMAQALKNKDEVWRAQGKPGFSIWKPYDGPHNGLVTVQRWPSFEEWESTRGTLPSIPECRSAVFDTLYPTNETPYYTTYYEEIK